MAQPATVPVVAAGVGGKLIPRLSQQDIFRRAINENIICTMETGSGMFHIAVLLLKHIMSLRRVVSDPKKVAVFIVNSIPLAEQQADLLQSQLPLRVNRFYGSMGLGHWDRERREKVLAELDVMVLTGHVLCDLLDHGHWNMKKISLLVFSEAHHCNKNHVYANIMRRHYGHCPASERPRVFGMTACPIFNARNPLKSLEQLQENMDSKVLAVRDSAFELALNAPKPYPDYPIPNMWNIFSEFGDLVFPEPGDVKDLSSRFEHVLTELGPLAADYFVLLYIQQIIENNVARSASHSTRTLEERPDDDEAIGSLTNDPRRTWSDLTNQYHESWARIQERIQKLNRSRMFSWFTPKLRGLVAILEANRSGDFSALIIVEQRQVASALAWLLSFVPELQDWVRASALIGNECGGNSTRASQQSILRNFRSGEINLLTTTPIAEEGLDFLACKLVTMVSYLQSRGIARNHNSAYVKRYRNLQEAESHLRRLYQQVGDDQFQTTDVMGLQEGEEVEDELVTPSTAISILYLWCSLLPPVPDVKIPPSILTPSICGSIQGPARKTWNGARRAAAYLLVKKLHQLGILNDDLLPIKNSELNREDKLQHVDEAPQKEGLLINPLSPWGDMWQSGSPVWMNPISLDGSLSLVALVTGREQLERELTISEGGACVHIKIHPGRPLHFVSEEEKLRYSNSPPRSACFFIPLLEPEGLPDYEKMNNLSTNVVKLDKDGWSSLDIMGSHVMEAHRLGSWVYKLLKLRPEVTLSSSPISLEGQAKCREVGHETYRSYWEAALGTANRRGHLDIPEDDLWLELISINRARFQSHSGLYGLVKLTNSGQLVVETSRIVTPSCMARVSPIPADIMRACTFFPDILGQLMIFSLTDSVNDALQTHGVPFELLLEALTLPSVQAGLDNERLKIVGDSFLDVCLCTHLFIEHQGHHGGQLFAMKNSASPLLQCIITDSIPTHRSWKPPASPTISEPHDASDENQTVPDQGHRFEKDNTYTKGLVDCTKSTLGAAYLSCGIEAALEVGHALGFPLGGPTPWHLRQEAFAFVQACEITELFAPLEEKLGYKFKNSSLVTEAFRHTTYDLPQGPSYHRLEFLGDSLFNLYAARYTYLKFPDMTAGQISSTRSRLVNVSVLGRLAVGLGLHKFILSSSANLQKVVADFAQEVEAVSLEETLQSYWKIDSPKAIVDVLKAIFGAIYVDSSFNLELVFERIHRVAAEILEYLGPDMPLDPTSELVQWVALQDCKSQVNTMFKSSSNAAKGRSPSRDTTEIIIHDRAISRATAATSALARPMAAEKALHILRDQNHDHALSKICSCPDAKFKPKALKPIVEE
ncbi:hypothetical protein B0J17DRAFT_681791 [Rhizoctonia solani]|nr:hypothetical protein B0J17DRAFT_681791 [Rhizoctonia solani]